MLKVIGAGYPRTGTTLLKTALNQLGFGPCHHMEDLFKNPRQIPGWLAVAHAGNRDWDTRFRGYVSACDFPSQHWYEEILAHSPGAKVILTVRDPEAWYVSMIATIYAISQDVPIRWVGRFLGVPEPEGPFPRQNDTAAFRKRVIGTKVASWVLLLAPIGIVAAMAWKVLG